MTANTTVAAVRMAKTTVENQISESLRIRSPAAPRDASRLLEAELGNGMWSNSRAMSNSAVKRLSLVFAEAYAIIGQSSRKSYQKWNLSPVFCSDQVWLSNKRRRVNTKN